MAEKKYVVFKLGIERFGLPIESVERILPNQSVTRIPKSPKMMLGVFDLRGSTIPAIDARVRFEMAESEEARNFVVVLTRHGKCALRVDRVDGIQAFESDDVDARASLIHLKNEDMIMGVGKQGDELTVLLDPEGLIPPQIASKMAA